MANGTPEDQEKIREAFTQAPSKSIGDVFNRIVSGFVGRGGADPKNAPAPSDAATCPNCGQEMPPDAGNSQGSSP